MGVWMAGGREPYPYIFEFASHIVFPNHIEIVFTLRVEMRALACLDGGGHDSCVFTPSIKSFLVVLSWLFYCDGKTPLRS